ncbi:OLC1v1037991C1 [Oldenlandia corymbosa var. corymbosa]|uniref:OLC1v1037991C1 n=1 Tax=Oldenlandia corymbosa var. corymbosa TaxID=529605 RepID=A0AAV1D1U8_OLDCO|nr:OLC1v1037991C1 [Oldenlandia corymbosa var. corymbosa]
MASSRIQNYATLALTLVVLASSNVGKTSAATYVVGWSNPAGGSASYAAFASQHSFRVGDILVFNFTTGADDLAIVTKQSYDSCSSSNPISLVTVGPVTVKLTSPGEAYFISTFSGHCSAGQKLAINVSSTAAAAPATPPPAPSPSAAAPSPKPAAPTPSASSPAATSPTPSMSAPSPAPVASVPSPAPGPAGEAPGPSLMAPSPNAPGTSPVTAPAPGPGGSPADMNPPPNAGAPVSTSTLSLVMLLFATAVFC